MNWEMIRRMRKQYAEGWTTTQLAEEYFVSKSVIRNIVNNDVVRWHDPHWVKPRRAKLSDFNDLIMELSAEMTPHYIRKFLKEEKGVCVSVGGIIKLIRRNSEN